MRQMAMYKPLTLLTEVLPKVVVGDARADQRYFLFDTGTIRFDLYQGPFTTDTTKQITPFADNFDYIRDVPRDAAIKIAQVLIESPDDDEYGMPVSKPQDCDDSDSKSYHRQRVMTPGYITTDDLGTDGRIYTAKWGLHVAKKRAMCRR